MYFLGQNIYQSGKNVSYQEPIGICTLAILLAVLLQISFPHWFGIDLSPPPPLSHVSQATRIGEEAGREEERILCGIPEKFAKISVTTFNTSTVHHCVRSDREDLLFCISHLLVYLLHIIIYTCSANLHVIVWNNDR